MKLTPGRGGDSIGEGGRAFRYNFAVTLFTCMHMHLTGGERVGIRPG